MAVTPPQLQKALNKYFSTGELRTLCFELGLDYENLSGDNKNGKALALVQYAQRHGLFNRVVAYVQQARPHVDLGSPIDTSESASSSAAQSEAKSGSTYNFYGPVTGSAIGEGSVQAENIAGRDINITHNYAEPTNKAEFAEQLVQLEALLKEAIANGEIEDERDAETAIEDIQDALAEVQHEEPRAKRIGRRLEDVQEILDRAGKVAEAARKTGTAAIKALPIISGLIKVVQTVF